MRTGKLFLGITIAISCCSVGFGVPSKLEKKVKKVVAKVFDVEETSFAAVSVSKELNDKLPVKITENNFFSIHKEDKLLGYAFLDKASSKTAKFDYLVLFNDKLQIKSSKVLIYREEYGGEISSKRWLRQFEGKNSSDELKYEKNIIAISGATISVKSMTVAVNNLLKTVKILQENNSI